MSETGASGEVWDSRALLRELALFRLPHSGVMVSMGTRAFTDPLGAFAETRGFSPDIRLAPESALTDAKRIALTAGESPRYAHGGGPSRTSSQLLPQP